MNTHSFKNNSSDQSNLAIGQKSGRVEQYLNSKNTVKVVFTLLVSIFILSLWLISHLSTEYSVTQFYPQNHAMLLQDKEIRRTFNLQQKSPLLYVITLPKNQTWLQKRNINKLQDMSTKFQQIDTVNQVISLPLIQGASLTDSELNVGSIFDRLPVKYWKNEIQKNSLLYPLLISSDFNSTLIAVESKLSSNKDLSEFHQKIEKEIHRVFPKAHIDSAGVPIIQITLSKIIHSELVKFFIISIFIFCGIFYFLFSHWTAIVLAFICLSTSNIVSIALLALFKIPMNSILVTLPIIISVAVMSLLIHTLHLWSQKIKSTEKGINQRWPLAVKTFLELALPNFLGAWTTGFGFLALYFSDIPIIKEYGWVVAVNVTLVSIFSQTLILFCLAWVEPKMRSWFDQPAYWSLFAVKYAKPIFYSISVVAIIGVILSTQLNFSGRLFDDLPKSDGVRASTEWIDTQFGGLVSYELVLTSPQEEFWKEPLSLKRIQEVTAHLRKHPFVGSVVSISDFFQSGIPNTKQQTAETFFLFSMAEKNPVPQFLNENGQKLRLMIRLKDKSSTEVEATRAWIQQVLKTAFNGIQLTEGGQSVYAHSINKEVSKELVYGFWQSLTLIGIFLIFMFRSFRWSIVACIPNLIPPAILMGAMALSGVSLKPGVALIFSIATGFSFNNTVYLLGRLRSYSSKKHLRLKQSLLAEANPCFFESFVMLIGFSIFLISHFSMNQTFGVFMMISITAGFLADLFFLPALLQLFPNLLISKNSSNLSVNKPDSEKSISIEKIAASFAVLVLLSLNSSNAQAKSQKSIPASKSTVKSASAQLDAQKVLSYSRKQIESKDDQAHVEMKIFEKNGESKVRQLEIKTLRKNGFHVLARILSPADLKGMGFLGSIVQGKESQWIYLPSSGQVRRVVTGKTKGGLLGSELSAEDLNSTAIQSASVKIFKEDKTRWWIEVTPAKGTSMYSRVLTEITKQDYLPQNTFYYSKDKLVKTVSFKNYVKIGKVWRFQFISVKNALNSRGTDIQFSNLKVNSGLKSQDFSQTALKEDET